MFALKVILWV